MSRRGAEFDRRTKAQAKRRYRKNHPSSDEELTVHHKVAIHAGKKLGIPNHVLRSGENAQAMPASEHREYHKSEPTLEEYATIAQGLLGLTQTDFFD